MEKKKEATISYEGYIVVAQWLYRDNGKENGSYSILEWLYTGNIGVKDNGKGHESYYSMLYRVIYG